jgi:hypothetical protein
MSPLHENAYNRTRLGQWLTGEADDHGAEWRGCPIVKPLPPELFYLHGLRHDAAHNTLGYLFAAVVAHPVTVLPAT